MMKRIMLIGPVGSGKTSLIQRIRGETLHYQKTQAVEFDGSAIDTPGEYIENRQYLYALTVTACDADVVILTQDAGSDAVWYSPGQSSIFSCRVIGVVTKTDIASVPQVKFAETVLTSAGAEKVFAVSCTKGTGIEELLACLAEIESDCPPRERRDQ